MDLSFTLKLIDSRKTFNAREVAPCSVLFNEKIIPSLFIACSNEDSKYFGLEPSANPPSPSFKFRMLNLKKQVYAIEIWLLFGEFDEKPLKLHLNPSEQATQKFLKLCQKHRMIGFHFYNVGTGLLTSAFTDLGQEEHDWFVRNYKVSKKLKSATHQKLYPILVDKLVDEMNDLDCCCSFVSQHKIDFFVQEGKTQVMMADISKLN